MESRYLEQKMRKRIERAQGVLPAIQAVLRIVLVAALLLGGKLACDYFVAQSVVEQQQKE
jgi:hypothetical protein